MATIKEQLIQAIRNASTHNPDVEAAPVCILWPDKEGQWMSIIQQLQGEDALPELFVLGDYQPDKRIGPAIWLRCVLAGQIEGIQIPGGCIPIFYLPNYSRQDLRKIENYTEQLKPLADLQFRGVLWSQINGKDWTALAFLKSDQGGLGLDVSQDRATINAIHSALETLLDVDIELLRNEHLNKDFFNALVTGGDPIKDILTWLDKGDAYRESLKENEWHAFIENCRSKLDFDPQNSGILSGAEKLVYHQGPWQQVWNRFCEAPHRYLKIPEQLRKIPVLTDLFSDKRSWPQWNDREEQRLREELLRLPALSNAEMRQLIHKLEREHSGRRSSVWSDLGQTPLARALEWLVKLIEYTTKSLSQGSVQDVLNLYTQSAWRADEAVLKAMSFMEHQDDKDSLTQAVRSIYLPWLEESARHFQKLIIENGYPGENAETRSIPEYSKSECILFVDGLRFDLAKQLQTMLLDRGFETEEILEWKPLPTLTSTGKPAVSPVSNLLTGNALTIDFEPETRENAQSLKGGNALKRLMFETGWQVLDRPEPASKHEHIWIEVPDIDQSGHDRGWNITREVDGILHHILMLIEELIRMEWKFIRIVTDHGWLLMPGGLPKTALSTHLTDQKWGRCALIKPGGLNEEYIFPWYWNSDRQIAFANGVSCYRAGVEYAHGGVSLQECLTLQLRVSAEKRKSLDVSVSIKNVLWQGLRCKVTADGDTSNLYLDIRLHAGNPETSLVNTKNPKALKGDKLPSIIIENEELIGKEATIVMIDEQGNLLAQQLTTIGGGEF